MALHEMPAEVKTNEAGFLFSKNHFKYNNKTIMIAVVKTGGKQYKVSPKSKLKIEKIKGEEGTKFVFDQVLLISSEDGEHTPNPSQEGNTIIGNPIVKGTRVEAKILKQARDKKIEVVKHKAKKRYNRRAGHRQFFTEVEIEKIVA